MNPKETVIAFNNCIHKRDIRRLEQSLTDNHSFVDSANTVVRGKTNCVNAWKGFFHGFPDYKNHFEEIKLNNNLVVIVGHSNCSDPLLDGPAIWTAKIEDLKIAEWRVYEDTDENRQLLGLNDE